MAPQSKALRATSAIFMRHRVRHRRMRSCSENSLPLLVRNSVLMESTVNTEERRQDFAQRFPRRARKGPEPGSNPCSSVSCDVLLREWRGLNSGDRRHNLEI